MIKGKSLKPFIKNKLIFYCNSIDDQMKGLLESMNVEVQLDTLPDTETKYLDYYKNLVRKFNRTFPKKSLTGQPKRGNNLVFRLPRDGL